MGEWGYIWAATIYWQSVTQQKSALMKIDSRSYVRDLITRMSLERRTEAKGFILKQ